MKRVTTRSIPSVFRQLLLLTILVPFHSAHGQWQQIGGFGGGGIFSVYFLDKVGSPGTGFVGLGNGAVYRTSNQGQSWQKCQTDPAQGNITSFTFVTSTQGWMTCREKNSTGGLYETFDGGFTWTLVPATGGDVWCAFYANNRIFVSGNGIPFYTSPNGGATPYPVTVQPQTYWPDEQNGIVFSDENPQNGVVSCYSGAALCTQDAGDDWLVTNYPTECWNPVAIGTSTFIAVSEANFGVSRSTDAGYTWNLRGRLPVKPTGDVNGSCQQLYAQSIRGLYVSNDEGLTWYPLGGPGNTVDTRFYVLSGATVFAGDSLGGLFELKDSLRAPSTPLLLTGAVPEFLDDGCNTIDTSIFIWASSGCSATQLLGYNLTLSQGLTFDTLHGKDSLKGTLYVPDSNGGIGVQYIPFGLTFVHDTLDSVRIKLRYNPNSGIDSATLVLQYSLDGYTLDTTIVIHFLRNSNANVSFSGIPVVLDASEPCVAAKSTFQITDGPCDSITVLDVHPEDSVHFSSSTSFPIRLEPDQSATITISGTGSTVSTIATMLDVTLSSRGIITHFTVPAQLAVDHDGPPHVGVPRNASVPPTNICNRQLASVPVQNLGCELLTFDSASWLASIPELTIVREPVFPDTILPGAKDSIVVEFSPSVVAAKTAEMLWHFHSGVKRVDTFVEIRTSSFSISRATLLDSLLDFDSLLICNDSERSFLIQDESCNPTTLERLLPPGDSEFQVVAPAINAVIQPGDTLVGTIHLAPASPGQKLDSIQLYFRDANGAGQWLTVPLQAVITPDTPKTLVTPLAIRMDSIAPCGQFDTSISVTNISLCRTVTVTAQLNAGSWFSMNSSGVPFTLAPGEQRIIPIHIQTNSDSAQSASVQFTGDGTNTVVSLTAHTAPLDRPEITASYTDTIFYAKLCASASKQFWLRNWRCVPVEIDSIGLTGDLAPFIVLAPSTNDTILAPGDSVEIQIGFDAEDTFIHTAALHYQTADSEISGSISITGITTTRPQSARIAIQSSDGSNPTYRLPGDTISILVYPMDNVPDSLGLTEISANVVYDGNLLTYTGQSDGLAGWSLASTPNNTGLTLQLTGQQSMALASNVPIALAYFTTTFSEPTSTNVTLANAAFNGGDSEYANCVLSPLSSGSFTFGTSPFCGDTLLGEGLLLQPISVTGIDISVAGSISYIHLALDVPAAALCHCTLFDELGTVVEDFGTLNIGAGNDKLTFPTRVASGAYFLTIEANGTVLSKKLTIAK